MATHSSQIETSISRLAQTAYGTPRTNADDFRRIINESTTVATRNINHEDDAAYENGSDLATDQWGTTAETSIDINPKFNFQDIGYQLHRALGAVSSSGPLGGLSTHVFTPQSMNVSRQLPASTFLKKYGGLRLELLPDMVSSVLTLAGGKTGRLSTSQSFVGSGKWSKDPAGYASPAITSDREYGYAGQASVSLYEAGVGTRQVETATPAGTATTPGNASLVITAAGLAGSPLTVEAPLIGSESAEQQTTAFKIALRANTVVRSFFEIGGTNTTITLTKWKKEANDATLNLAIGENGTGITSVASSANTTAGVAGAGINLSCPIENWTLSINNPAADDGYRLCSPYIIAGNPMSGQTRSEYLVGARSMTLSFSARDEGNDDLEDWITNATDLEINIPIIGIEANDYSLRIAHTRARVMNRTPITNAGGDFIGMDATVNLLAGAAGDGSIPFSATLVNNISSYTT